LNGILTDPLESEQFEYVSLTNARYAISRKLRPASLGTTPVETKYFWNASGAGKVLEKVVIAGSTKDNVVSWNTVAQKRAVFLSRDPNDALRRVTSIDGPCQVNTDMDTACADAGVPRTTFEYFPPGSGANSARLSAVVRFATAADGQRTEFSQYTPEGDPRKVLDVGNQIETTYTYQGRLITSQRVEDLDTGSFAVTEWQYDNEKVRSVRYPEGNFEVFCYRTSPFPDCSGPQKVGLRWRAKVDGLTGFTLSSGWSERIEYSYNDAGDQVEERRYSVQEPSEPRLALRTNPDLHGRPTFTRAGNAGAANRHFSSRSHFDGADNRDAVAPAYVKAPSSPLHEYCLTSSGTPSPECWWFRYDRANRVNQATSPTTNLARLSKACFDYSPAGKLIAVAVGSSNGLTCDTSFNQPGVSTGLTGTDTAGLVYGWDDFGNVISVFNSGTDDPGTESRYVYDARGNVTERKTPGTGVYWHRLVYDRRDRLVELRREGGAGPVVLYQLEYDKSSISPPQAVRHTDGKLARRIDSYGSTWYSYDSWGNVEAEFRLRNICNKGKGVHCEPSTRYSWNRNGGIAWVWYPFGRLVTYGYGVGSLQDRVSSISVGVFASGGSQTSRTVLSDIAWEPYGSVRGYSLNTLAGQEQLALEYHKGVDGSPTEDCDAPPSGPTDGSGRSVALLVGQGPYSPNQSSPVTPTYFSQKIGWTGDQVTRTTTCLKGRTGSDFSVHRQTFDYDAMERMIREDMEGFPRIEGDGILEEKIFDVRGNREDETEDGYDNLQTYYSPVAKDRMTEQCWWRGLLNPNECLASYNYTHGSSGVLQTISGLQNRWTTDFTYSHTQALSDVYSSVGRGGAGAWIPLQMSYDAFNRRRYKANALGYGQEFYYGLQKDLLVDQAWSNSKVETTLDEYIWLDGRPVMAIRGRVDIGGTHLEDYYYSGDGARKCARPMDDGAVACGFFHLVTNLQSFPLLAISNATGQVASFQLPDADGSVNSSRMMGAWGGQGIDLGFEFPLNERFRKQARFRASWTGANGPRTGVQAFYLDGVEVLTPAGQELGQVWSAWSPVVNGAATVRWTVSCPTAQACSSAGDAFEWQAWEDGAEQFHTRLRFPGQYADAETDFYENWHRYYDPQNGRYLSPEPLLQSPEWVATQIRLGRQTPTYSYAANNPVRLTDSTGLAPDWSPSWDRRADTISRERAADRARERLLAPYRRAYDRWWSSRPEKFRTWGPVSNWRRHFGDTSAPVCKDYAEAAAEAISRDMFDGAAQAKWDWDRGLGVDNPPIGAAPHDVTQLYSREGQNIGHFDPWIRW
jgi:RHS repeat-associated protein